MDSRFPAPPNSRLGAGSAIEAAISRRASLEQAAVPSSLPVASTSALPYTVPPLSRSPPHLGQSANQNDTPTTSADWGSAMDPRLPLPLSTAIAPGTDDAWGDQGTALWSSGIFTQPTARYSPPPRSVQGGPQDGFDSIQQYYTELASQGYLSQHQPEETDAAKPGKPPGTRRRQKKANRSRASCDQCRCAASR